MHTLGNLIGPVLSGGHGRRAVHLGGGGIWRSGTWRSTSYQSRKRRGALGMGRVELGHTSGGGRVLGLCGHIEGPIESFFVFFYLFFCLCTRTDNGPTRQDQRTEPRDVQLQLEKASQKGRLERMGSGWVSVCSRSEGGKEKKKKRRKPEARRGRRNRPPTVTFPYVVDFQKILRHKLQREYPGSMHDSALHCTAPAAWRTQASPVPVSCRQFDRVPEYQP